MSNHTQPQVPDTQPEGQSKLTPNDHLIFGLLREIRASAQQLQKVVAETLNQASKLDAPGRTALMTSFLGGKMLDWIEDTIKPNLDSIDQLFLADVIERDWCSDHVEFIRLNWLQVNDLWPQVTITAPVPPAPQVTVISPSDYNEQIQRLDRVKVCLDQIIYQCASLTLSPRVAETLENLRVGQPLDWEFAFGSELPIDPELRKRLLEELAQEGGVLKSAVVDVDQRVIYKVAQSRAEQRRSTFYLVAFVVVCGAGMPFILAWGMPWMLSKTGALAGEWPLTRAGLGRLYVTYVLIFFGSGAHVAIEALKVAKAQTRPSFLAMNDWILWIHVRFISIFCGLAWILVGYILISVGMPKLQWQAAFFAGYSIDSVTSLFLSRFETTVKTKTDELTGESKKTEPAKQ